MRVELCEKDFLWIVETWKESPIKRKKIRQKVMMLLKCLLILLKSVLNCFNQIPFSLPVKAGNVNTNWCVVLSEKNLYFSKESQTRLKPSTASWCVLPCLLPAEALSGSLTTSAAGHWSHSAFLKASGARCKHRLLQTSLWCFASTPCSNGQQFPTCLLNTHTPWFPWWGDELFIKKCTKN